MRHSRLLKKARKLQIEARRQRRLKDPVLNGAEPYVEGAIDPLTGRPQGPDFDKMTREQRAEIGVAPGITNAMFRAQYRKHFASLGLPPVGHPRELTRPEFIQWSRLTGYDPQREEFDLPFDCWDLTADQRVYCCYWLGEVRRGEMTREEYHRLAAEMTGKSPDAPSSSSSSGG